MRLWSEWYRCVRQLRPACSRSRTFCWLVVALAALSTRLDLAGVTSFVRTPSALGRTDPPLLTRTDPPSVVTIFVQS